MSFTLWKMIFMNGRRGIMKIEEFYGEKKGRKMKVSFEWRKGKNDDLKQFLLMKSTEFLSIKSKQQ